MVEGDRERWDRVHAESHDEDSPSAFLQNLFQQFSESVPRGRALDIACGKGRNALFLAQQGFDVTAIDISPIALEVARRRAERMSLSISWQRADLEKIQLEEGCYDLVADFNYLQRSLFPRITKSLRPGGAVVFETFLIDQQTIGQPKNPDYLLGHNELLNAFRDLRVLWYREGKFTDGGAPAFRASLFAQKE
jgi:2-polyprenyl-3-methyl-5-hydroxy-6-metoxy-1,4-benzoquinol methylase